MTDQDTTSTTNEPGGDAVTEAQEAVGQLLRDTREQAGLGLADVARVLRISQRYLDALENGNNTELPGPTYAIGFVRSYAEYLNLDGDEIVRRYKAQASGVDRQADLVFPKPIPDSGVPGGAVLGLGVIVAAIAYGVWYWDSTRGDVAVDRVQPVPERLAEELEGIAEPEAEQVAAAQGNATGETPSATATSDADGGDATAAEADGADGAEVVTNGSVAPLPDDAPTTPRPELVEEPVSTAPETPEAAEAPGGGDGAQVAQTSEAAPDAQPPAAEPEAPAEPAPETQSEAQSDAQSDAQPEPAGDALADQVEAPADAVPDADTEPDADVVGDAAQQAATDAAAGDNEAAADTQDGPSRITVRAKSNSWIQVRDVALDRLLFTRLLRAGDEYQVPDREGLELMTGNAGALELVVDGEPIQPLGEVGEVRRNVVLDPEQLKSGGQ